MPIFRGIIGDLTHLIPLKMMLFLIIFNFYYFLFIFHFLSLFIFPGKDRRSCWGLGHGQGLSDPPQARTPLPRYKRGPTSSTLRGCSFKVMQSSISPTLTLFETLSTMRPLTETKPKRMLDKTGALWTPCIRGRSKRRVWVCQTSQHWSSPVAWRRCNCSLV